MALKIFSLIRKRSLPRWRGPFLLLCLMLLMAGLSATQVEAQTNNLMINVISARTELDAPNGPILKGDPVTDYKYLINIDNTGDPNDSLGFPFVKCLELHPSSRRVTRPILEVVSIYPMANI